jgi:hypothetical protein
MSTAPRTHAVLIARMRDGSTAFVSRLRTGDMLTARRNHAWVMTIDEAREMQTRLNGVAELGQCHKEVSFFDACTVKVPRTARK